MPRYLSLLLCLLLATRALAQHDVPATSAFTISGGVEHPLTFTVAQLEQMKPDDLGDVAVTNHRGDEKTTLKQLKGVLLRRLLDSAVITAGKPKEYSGLVISLIASDGYRNVYSWNELFNTPVGDRVYIITSRDGGQMHDMKDRILVLSLADIVSGRRHLKGLAKIEVSKIN